MEAQQRIIFNKSKNRKRGSKSRKAQTNHFCYLFWKAQETTECLQMEMQWNPVLKALTHCSHLDQTLPPQSHLLLMSTHLSIVRAAYDRRQYTGEERYLLYAVIHERADHCVGRETSWELRKQSALNTLPMNVEDLQRFPPPYHLRISPALPCTVLAWTAKSAAFKAML